MKLKFAHARSHVRTFGADSKVTLKTENQFLIDAKLFNVMFLY